MNHSRQLFWFGS